MNSDIHALVGAYAVDALDDLERAAFERHLAECPACQQEVAGLQEAAGLLGALSTTAPPPSLRDRVLADITTVRPLPPAVEPPVLAQPAEQPAQPGAHATGGRSRFRPRLLVAAAAALIALGGAVTIAQPWDDETSQSQLTAAERVLAADDAETYTQKVGDATATLVRSEQLNQAVLVTEDMPEAPEGKVYELWLDHEGVGMVPAGLMEGDEPEVVLEGDPATAIGFGITVEPEGGSEEPTSAPVTQIAFENA